MLAKISFAAGVLAVAALMPVGASAAPAMAQTRTIDAAAGTGSLVEKTHYRRCRFWRHECAARWGWRTRGYYHCLWRHGC